MTSFSIRYGHIAPRTLLQEDDMDMKLRTDLSNSTYTLFFSSGKYDNHLLSSQEDLKKLFLSYCTHYSLHLDNSPLIVREFWVDFKKIFDAKPFYDVYDFLEFLIFFSEKYPKLKVNFISLCNSDLEKNLSAYRIIDSQVIKINDATAITTIENTLSYTSTKYSPVHQQVQHSLACYKKGDFRNSIKESISAVEGLVTLILDEKPTKFSSDLKKLEKKLSLDLHAAFRNGITNFYGYTSDADGIRHSLLDEDNLESEDALYMIIICSSFINYLLAKLAKTPQS